MERERRRLGQVRKAFAAAVDTMRAGKPVDLEFLCACVDYIATAMHRLHAQDQRLHDLLLPAVTQADGAGLAPVLAELDRRLAASRAALAGLVAAAQSYRRTGGADGPAFAAAIDRFMDVYFNTLLKGQHSTLPWQEKRFGTAEWDHVAGVDNAALQVEATLFALVKRLAPPGSDPDAQVAGPPRS